MEGLGEIMFLGLLIGFGWLIGWRMGHKSTYEFEPTKIEIINPTTNDTTFVYIMK